MMFSLGGVQLLVLVHHEPILGEAKFDPASRRKNKTPISYVQLATLDFYFIMNMHVALSNSTCHIYFSKEPNTLNSESCNWKFQG